jgi:uncharacterized membrane protein YccF (DUF307 family)
MKLIGNLAWLILGGLIEGLAWLLSGVILCLTIVFIPFGLKCFKIAGLAFAPFGKDVDITFDEHPVANILWLIFMGWQMSMVYFLSGILFCLTIIFIPIGIQCFKMGKVALFPFGAEIF